MKRFLAVANMFIVSACASTTNISVSDPDARIYVNDEYVGMGHAYYSDRKPAFTKQRVTIRKDGCLDQGYSFRRNEKPDPGAILGGLLFTVPILWVTEYKNTHAYEFDCTQQVED